MEKKKLSGFKLLLIILTLVLAGGAGVLGFLQKKQFDANTQAYATKAAELKKMKEMDGYPSQESVDTLSSAITNYEGVLTDLGQDLATSTGIKFENVEPAKFSARVTKATKALRAKYSEAGVELPEEWSLGFEKYVSILPPKEATGILLYNLEALVWLHEELLSSNPSKLVNLHRKAVALEVEAGESVRQNNQSNRRGKNQKPAVVAMPMEISFITKENGARDFLNRIVNADKYFFTIDTLKLQEVKAVGLERTVNSAPAEPEESFGLDAVFSSDESTTEEVIEFSDEKKFTQVLGKELVAVFIDLNLTYLPEPINPAN